MSDVDRVVEMDAVARATLISSKATCPFIGSAIAQGLLPVRGDLEQPLASVREVSRLGSQQGGSLGMVMAFFARSNHTFLRDHEGRLAKWVPEGYFSLDFPESQGSHPGDSGILQDGPQRRRPFAFSEENFARLSSRATDGYLTRSAVGDFIAENVGRDSKARSFGLIWVLRVVWGVLVVMWTVARALVNELVRRRQAAHLAWRYALVRLSKTGAEDNMLGSSGEFALLFALLVDPSGASGKKARPVLQIDHLRMMFQEKRLPAGWDQRRKTLLAWLGHTVVLVATAYAARVRNIRSARNPPAASL